MYKEVHTVIIGGGASGMCAAILLKRQLKDKKIILIEALDRVGKKLIVTGNGRCNISNRFLDYNAYHGENAEFCHSAISRFGLDFTENFFNSLGVPLCEGDDGKMYPYSLQASAVVDVMRLELSRLYVEVLTETFAQKIMPQNNGYRVLTDKSEIRCKNVIVASGGIAGGNKLGSFGTGYKMLADLGFTLISPTASIVQLKTVLTPIKSLNGIKHNSTVTLYADGKKCRSETGELLFTRYGISGPPVLQISRGADLNGDRKVKINFMPEYEYKEILELLFKRREILRDRTAESFFTGLLPKMLGHTILKSCNIKLTDAVCKFTERQCRAIAEQMYSFTLSVVSSNGMENAQVTAGGISTKDFCDDSMEALKYKGLYAIGEVLDIDGDCGGFNLQWAWSSAAAATQDIIGKNQ